VKEQAKHRSGDGSADDRYRQLVVHASACHAATQREANRLPGGIGGGELCVGVRAFLGRTRWRRRGIAGTGVGHDFVGGQTRGACGFQLRGEIERMTIQQPAFAPLQFLNGGDRSVEYAALLCRPGLEGRLPGGK